MKILVVCSGNAENFSLEKNQAFIFDQIKAIEGLYHDVHFEVFALKKKGIIGYIHEFGKLKHAIRNFQPDIIHTHGGHTGFLSILQRKIPVVITFHGSDINRIPNRYISLIAALFSASCIFVSKNLKKKLFFIKGQIVPCGVDLSIFYPIASIDAKKQLGMNPTQKYILFPSSFDNKIKNFPLAQSVIHNFPDYQLMEISNRTRGEVNLLLNGADALLMTSFSEGSPQTIKEALACNVRIVSVDVGDISEQLEGVDACFCCSYKPEELIEKLKKSLACPRPQKGRKKAENYNNLKIAETIVAIYNQVLKK
ncbi:MAG TPA: glycosyltransferase [Paludibacteraceae bacterium]|nr:glycosyltransferase [Paludibacteraceae bacterium]